MHEIYRVGGHHNPRCPIPPEVAAFEVPGDINYRQNGPCTHLSWARYAVAMFTLSGVSLSQSNPVAPPHRGATRLSINSFCNPFDRRATWHLHIDPHFTIEKANGCDVSFTRPIITLLRQRPLRRYLQHCFGCQPTASALPIGRSSRSTDSRQPNQEPMNSIA